MVRSLAILLLFVALAVGAGGGVAKVKKLGIPASGDQYVVLFDIVVADSGFVVQQGERLVQVEL